MSYYRNIIIKDISSEKSYKRSLKFFTLSFYLFVSLQLATYFHYFHNKVLGNIDFIMTTKTKMIFVWDPRLIVIAYEHLITFMIFVFVNIIFLVFAFVHFDVTQRNKVIHELLMKSKQNEDN